MIITPCEFTEAMNFVSDSCNELKHHTKALFRNLELNYFAHVRVREKISMSGLATSVNPAPEWFNLSMPIPIPNKSGLYIASAFPEVFPSEKLSIIRELYGFDHIAFYVTHYKGYCDVFILCGDSGNPRVINNYANHYNKMVDFACQFRRDAQKLIKTVEKKYLYVYEQNAATHDSLFLNEYDDDTLQSTKNLNRWILKEIESQLSNLSQREFECLVLAAKGHTAKESARDLGLSSYRSIEGYLENAKNKLGCYGPGGKRKMIALYKTISRT